MTKTKTKLINLWHFIKRSNIFMVVTLIMLLMTMVVSTNYANSQSLERNELEKELRLVEDDFRLASSYVSKLQATERIEQESQKLNLVKIQTQDIYYLSDNRDLFALR